VVLKKVSSGLRIRHLIPSGFVFYLLTLPIALVQPIWLVPGILYLFLILLFALRSGLSLSAKAALFAIYPALHISYGSGFLKGLFTLLTGKKPSL
jgi:hypothetical protein